MFPLSGLVCSVIVLIHCIYLPLLFLPFLVLHGFVNILVTICSCFHLILLKLLLPCSFFLEVIQYANILRQF